MRLAIVVLKIGFGIELSPLIISVPGGPRRIADGRFLARKVGVSKARQKQLADEVIGTFTRLLGKDTPTGASNKS
jgi:hypothetical protein